MTASRFRSRHRLSRNTAGVLFAWLLITAMAPAAEPQPTGGPLTEAEREYVQRPEYERRPGWDSWVFHHRSAHQPEDHQPDEKGS